MTWTPGHAFRNGKLYVFSDSSVEVLRPWGPGAGAWRREPPSGWRGFYPDLRLDFMRRTTRDVERALERIELWMPFDGPSADRWIPSRYIRYRADAYRAFLGEIPDMPRRLVSRLGAGHWQSLQLLNRCGAVAGDLLASNPALALAVAARGLFDRSLSRTRTARVLLRHRQRAVAGRLGFPGTEAMARLLRKIPPEAATITRLLDLRRAASDPATLCRLAHLRPLSSVVLRIATDPVLGRAVADGYLREVAATTRQAPPGATVWMLREVLELEERLGSCRSQPFRTIAQLEARHAVIVGALASTPAALPAGQPFPPPPFSGASGIEPIGDTNGLVFEGHQMRHCVAAYARDALQGTRAFYRVLAPERATLSLLRTPEGWKLGELRGPANTNVSPGTRRTVLAWIKART